jgi:hypothetical protein
MKNESNAFYKFLKKWLNILSLLIWNRSTENTQNISQKRYLKINNEIQNSTKEI